MSTQQTQIALVDCNNFYVSCERIFRPDLLNKPVAVLSNNDGCIVSRSQEVKDLGIKMAVPVHQVQQLLNKHRVHLFSSNYTLYADMSDRVMQCLEAYAPQVEVYSIDEAFLDITGLYPHNTTAYGLQIKKLIQQRSGIPVCVGVGPTKTLAKLANYAAKKWNKTGGVVDLSLPNRREKLMRLVPVNEVWGVGRQTTKRLKLMGVNTVFDLSIQPVELIQAQFNIVLARTVMELNSIACLSLEDITVTKQQIICSRSFKKRITDYHILAEALACFCLRAAEKLRKQQSVTASIRVFIRTNPYNPDEAQYHRSIHTILNQATGDSRQIIHSAKKLLKEIFKTGYRYQKCGVQLGHIQPASIPKQIDLFDFTDNKQDKSQKLMIAIDQINQRFSKGIAVSTAAVQNNWQHSVEHLSKRYTTNWDELAKVKCS